MTSIPDALSGVTFTDEIPEDELIADAIVITRLIHAETGRESFHITVNNTITTIVQIGLMHCALRVVEDGDWERSAEDGSE